jgi:predicted dehydrogenase
MKMRGAVIGVGYLGTFHAQKYKALCEGAFSGKIECVGVCDSSAEQSQKVASSLALPSFVNPKDLLGRVDLVSIATVTQSHFDLAKMFLENGVHVNVEKPIAATSEQGRALIKLAKEKRLILSVGHSERFSPAYKALEARASKPLFMELQRHAPYKSRGADVSVVHDLMIHDIDLALNLDKSEVKVLSAQGGRLISPTLDWARCELAFASGARAHISVSRMASAMTRTLRSVSAQEICEANLQTGDFSIASRLGPSEAKLETHAFGKSDNLMFETEAFFRAVLGDAAPVITGEQGQMALEISDSVVAMSAQGSQKL